MRSKLGLSARIRGVYPIGARQQTAMGKIVLPLLLAMTVIPWLQAIPARAQATSTPRQLVKNIVTDFGAKCDGVADDAPAFAAFNTWALAQTLSIVLTIPKGRSCTFKTYSAGSWFAKGIKKLTVSGYGATLSDNNGAGIFFLAAKAQYQDNAHSARLATVSAGASSVELTNAGTTCAPNCAALFAVGQYALITGYDLQGLWNAPYGYPSNPHYFEYVQIVGKNPNTGVITFGSPLKNTYKSTWPNYNSGSGGEVDNGGPATLYALDPSWDMEVEYQGLTIARPTAQTYAAGRSVTYRDVTFTGVGCAIPTQNKLWQVINSTGPNCDIEADKLVESIVITNSTINSIHFQSSSIDLFTASGSTFTQILGSPKRTVISDSSIAAFTPPPMPMAALTRSHARIALSTNSVGRTTTRRDIWRQGPVMLGSIHIPI